MSRRRTRTAWPESLARRTRGARTGLVGLAGMIGLLLLTAAPADALDPTRLPASPDSPPLEAFTTGLDPAFCADWNPEFGYRGYRCCYLPAGSRRERRKATCSPERRVANYCDEMTLEQRQYTAAAEAGRLGDVLELIDHEMALRGQQAYCTVNTGFLAFGRRVIPSTTNRIAIRRRDRCIDFGTDPMVGMLEWTGRQVARRYAGPEPAGVRLVVGDIAAPRGGCLMGRRGRRGPASHTSGQDVVLGFLHAKAGQRSPDQFSTQFDAEPNWWLVKQLFRNPYACVKVVFLDRRHISRLAREAAGDPDWLRFGKFIRHVKHHRNHFHVRVGEGPGAPGCREQDLEDEELESEGEDEHDDPGAELGVSASASAAGIAKPLPIDGARTPAAARAPR